MWIVFVGPPGAGKGTQAERVIDYLKITHLSTGDTLREAVSQRTRLGKIADEYMSSGQLVPDPIIIQMVGERLESQQYRGGCLFDGFPRTLGQAQALDEYMQGRGTPLDMVIEIRVDEDELFKRLGSRGRQDDDPEVIRERLVAYREQTQPLLEYYERHGILRPILGTGTPDEVFQRIETALNELDRPRVT